MNDPQPGGLPPTDLAGAFGRAGGLVGALPPTPRRRTSTPQDDAPTAPRSASASTTVTDTAVTEAPPADADDAQPVVRPDAVAGDGAGADAVDDEDGQAGTGGGKGRPVVFYVPLSVRNRLTAFRKATRATTAEVLLDAFDAGADQLPALLGAGLSGRPSRFQRASTRRTATDDDPLVQVFVSLSAHNLGVIDDITAEVAPGATRARSKVAAAALNAFLPPTDDHAP